MDWSASGAMGASSGMVVLWKKGLLSLNYCFRGEGYTGVNAEWKG